MCNFLQLTSRQISKILKYVNTNNQDLGFGSLARFANVVPSNGMKETICYCIQKKIKSSKNVLIGIF